MRWRLASGLLLLALSMRTQTANAEAGIRLAIDDCTDRSSRITNACDSNTGAAFTLVGSAIIPAVTKSSFVGAIAILDMFQGADWSQTTALVDWWRADACRSGAFIGSMEPGVTPSCPTLWDQVPPFDCRFFAYPVGPNNPVYRFRFLLSGVLAFEDVYDLTGDETTEVGVFRLTVGRMKTVGEENCAGCADAALLVLNEIQLQGLYDTSEADYVRIVSPLEGRNYLRYSGSDPVPVRNRTWGAIKALYR